MNGAIEGIRIFPAKGSAGIELAEVMLVKNSGLEGDRHAFGGERQVSILLAGSRAKMLEAEEQGLCFSRFKENITIKHEPKYESVSSKPGDELTIEEAALEITAEIKRCHDECVFYKTGKSCSLAGYNLFAKVLKSGMIRVGDKVRLKQT